MILKESDGSLAWGHGLNLSPSDTAEEDEDLYDCVENEEAEGDEIYEDLMRSETVPTPVCGSGKGWAGGQVGRVVERCHQPLRSLFTAQDDGVRQTLLLPAGDPAD